MKGYKLITIKIIVKIYPVKFAGMTHMHMMAKRLYPISTALWASQKRSPYSDSRLQPSHTYF